MHSEDGFTFKGDLVTDKVCLGNGDPHTTVCLSDHKFYSVTDLIEDDWMRALQDYAVVSTVFGLGFAEPESNSYSFVARGVHEGLLNENIYALSMASYQSVQKLGIDSSHI